jgi:hypothetical protein
MTKKRQVHLTIAHTIQRAEFQTIFGQGRMESIAGHRSVCLASTRRRRRVGDNLKRLKFKRANFTRVLFMGALGDRFEVRGKFKADFSGKWRGGFGVVCWAFNPLVQVNTCRAGTLSKCTRWRRNPQQHLRYPEKRY